MVISIMVLLFFKLFLGEYWHKSSPKCHFQSRFHYKKKVPCWGEHGTSYILEYWKLFHIILIHPLNKIIYQMMKICRPVFSLFHGYI